MLVGIGIIVAGLVFLGLATWMHSRAEDDGEGTIIWSIVQLSCVLVTLFGAFMIYQSITNPPKPATESFLNTGWRGSIFVEVRGFEPLTPCLQSRCSPS